MAQEQTSVYSRYFRAAQEAFAQGNRDDARRLLEGIPENDRTVLYENYLREQDRRQQARESVQDLNVFERIGTQAGLTTGRLMLGVSDLLSGEDDTQAEPNFVERMLNLPTTSQDRAAQSQYMEDRSRALYEDAPISTAFGEFVGGTLAAIPLVFAAEGIPFAGGAAAAARLSKVVQPATNIGRASTATLARAPAALGSGAIEGYLYYPRENETRSSNAAETAAFALLGEALGNGITAYRAARSAGVLGDEKAYQNISEALAEQGIDMNRLRPETQEFLSNLRGDFDLEKAIEGAKQTEFGFALTAGEASGDFGLLSKEAISARSEGAGAALRQFKTEQNRGIIEGSERIAAQAGGDTSLTSEGVGTSLQRAMMETQENQRDAYGALYKSLEELSERSDFNIQLPTTNIQNAFDQMVKDHGSQYEALLTDIGRRFQDFGVFETERFTPSSLLAAVEIDRKPLTLTNLEELRKFLNDKYSSDDVAQRIVRNLKDALDDTADLALQDYENLSDEALRAAGIDPVGARAFLDRAFEARQAFREYKGMWEARDIINDIVDFKPGTDTPKLDPSQIAKRVMSRPENVNRVADALTANNQLQALDDLRTFVLKDMFEGAINLNNINTAGEAVFSGAKLTSYINSNRASLEALFTPEQFASLKGFEEQVGRATKRPEGVVNYSNTAYKIFDFFFNSYGKFRRIPFGAQIAEGVDRGIIRDNTLGAAAEALRLNDGFHPGLNALMRQVLTTQARTPAGGALVDYAAGPIGETVEQGGALIDYATGPIREQIGVLEEER